MEPSSTCTVKMLNCLFEFKLPMPCSFSSCTDLVNPHQSNSLMT